MMVTCHFALDKKAIFGMNDIIEPDNWYLDILNCRCPICGELEAFRDPLLGELFKQVSKIHGLLYCRFCKRVYIVDTEKRTAQRLPETAWDHAR